MSKKAAASSPRKRTSKTPADVQSPDRKRVKTEGQEQKAEAPFAMIETLSEDQGWVLSSNYQYAFFRMKGFQRKKKKFRIKGWLTLKDFKQWDLSKPYCTASVKVSPEVARAFGRVNEQIEGRLRELKATSASFGTPFFRSSECVFKSPLVGDMLNTSFNRDTLRAVDYDVECDLSIPGRPYYVRGIEIGGAGVLTFVFILIFRLYA